LKPIAAGFPKSYRLNDPREYSRVFESATLRRRSGSLRLTAAGNTMPTARLGLVVSKRALRRAVDRNRAKRVLRDAFRIRRPELPAMDIILQVTGPCTNDELREAFVRLIGEMCSSGR
jgi:ribonuclease P protein component